VVVHACNPSILEAESGRSSLGLTLPKTKKIPNHKQKQQSKNLQLLVLQNNNKILDYL
jgi:hypothetical protein